MEHYAERESRSPRSAGRSKAGSRARSKAGSRRSKSGSRRSKSSNPNPQRVYRPPDVGTGQQRTRLVKSPPDIETGHISNLPLKKQLLPPSAAPSPWGLDWDSPKSADAPAPIVFPTRKIAYPQVSVAASHLTDSGAEDDNGGVYHLARDRLSASDQQNVTVPSKRHRENLQKWYQQRKEQPSQEIPIPSRTSRTPGPGPTSPIRSMSSEEDSHFRSLRSLDTDDEKHDTVWSEDDYWKTKQPTAFLSITLTSVQLLVLMMQLAMCGVANLDVNPMIGPFPDAFSEWGGKNAYLMLSKNEWWRIITPAFLHVGVLHLFANAFCQLETVALFEREWGSLRWAAVYLLSAGGCTLYSSVFDPNTIAVGSSGALMGMYAAKLSQVMCHTLFDVNKSQENDVIRLDQLSGVLCGLTLVTLTSAFTYIDWSGHMGGLLTGLFAGMLLFCRPITSLCSRLVWATIGLLGLVGTLFLVVYFLLTEIEPDQELVDACNYFRNLFPENYECGCLWQ
jgi:membrane associated rhomboid family serine protease